MWYVSLSTGVLKEEIKAMHLEEYKLVSAFCRENKIHGGSCIFATKDFEANDFVALKQVSIEEHCELSAIVSKSNKTVILALYRTPSLIKDDLNLFLNKLTEVLTFCGDL